MRDDQQWVTEADWRWTISDVGSADKVVLLANHRKDGYRLGLNGAWLGDLRCPTEARPWVDREFLLPGARHAVIAVEWQEDGVEAYLFVNGRDVRDGILLETRRAVYVAQIDVFAKNVSSFVKSGSDEALIFGGVGAVATAATASPLGPLAALSAGIVGFSVCYSYVMTLVRGIRWLATKHAWEPHLRGLLAGLMLVSPVALFAVLLVVLSR